MKARLKGNWLVLISSGLSGMSAVNARIAYDCGAGTVLVSTMRFALATVFLWLYSLAPSRRGKLALTGEQLLSLFILGGVAHYAMSLCYFAAINFIPVSLASVIVYLYPFMVNLFMAAALEEKINARRLCILFAATTGSVLMMWAPGIYIDWRGILLAFGSATSCAAYIILLGGKYAKKLDGLDTITINTYIAGFTALSMLITGFLSGGFDINVSPKGWAAIFVIAFCSSTISPLLFYLGVREIGPSKASILGTFEPVVTVIFSIIVLREALMYSQALGMAMVLASVLAINRTEAGRRLKPQRQ